MVVNLNYRWNVVVQRQARSSQRSMKKIVNTSVFILMYMCTNQVQYVTVVHSTCDFKLAGTKHCYYFRRSGQWQFKHQKFQQKNLVNSVSFLIENSIWLYEYIPMVTSINNVPRFLAIFDLPTYLHPISSDFEKGAYLMTSDFVWPTYLPKFPKMRHVCRITWI